MVEEGPAGKRGRMVKGKPKTKPPAKVTLLESIDARVAEAVRREVAAALASQRHPSSRLPFDSPPLGDSHGAPLANRPILSTSAGWSTVPTQSRYHDETGQPATPTARDVLAAGGKATPLAEAAMVGTEDLMTPSAPMTATPLVPPTVPAQPPSPFGLNVATPSFSATRPTYASMLKATPPAPALQEGSDPFADDSPRRIETFRLV